MNENQELKGLGGWLILVGIAVIFTPVRMLATLVPLYHGILTDGTWEALTTQGSVSYNGLLAPLLTCEIAFNALLILASLYLIYLFFSKHYWFPRVYIALLVASLIFMPVDAWVVTFIVPDEPVFDPDTAKEFARTLVAAVIWIPYMLVSKRVKATFVEKMPLQQVPTAP